MDELTVNFKSSLFSESSHVICDYIELEIDSFINDGILKDIPIVNTIVAALKVGKNIHDRNLLRQTLTFLNEFNNNNISEEKIKEYKEEIEKNPKKCQEELGRIELLLNKFIDKEKSVMLAKLFKKYIDKLINWNEFCELSEIINRVFIEDVDLLKNIYEKTINTINYDGKWFRIERLNSLGLVSINVESEGFAYAPKLLKNKIAELSELGNIFVEIII